MSSATSTVMKYVGRTTNFKGKTLWEIVGSLKNFGVGRFIVRSVFGRYPEPSFMKIVKVEACPDEVRDHSVILIFIHNVSFGIQKTAGLNQFILWDMKLFSLYNYKFSSQQRIYIFILECYLLSYQISQERRRVRVWVEKTFRGRKLPNLTVIYRTSYKTDYQLIPKNEEAKLLAAIKKEGEKPAVILPNRIEMPPLMKKFIIKDHENKGLEVSITYHYQV